MLQVEKISRSAQRKAQKAQRESAGPSKTQKQLALKAQAAAIAAEAFASAAEHEQAQAASWEWSPAAGAGFDIVEGMRKAAELKVCQNQHACAVSTGVAPFCAAALPFQLLESSAQYDSSSKVHPGVLYSFHYNAARVTTCCHRRVSSALLALAHCLVLDDCFWKVKNGLSAYWAPQHACLEPAASKLNSHHKYHPRQTPAAVSCTGSDLFCRLSLTCDEALPFEVAITSDYSMSRRQSMPLPSARQQRGSYRPPLLMASQSGSLHQQLCRDRSSVCAIGLLFWSISSQSTPVTNHLWWKALV